MMKKLLTVLIIAATMVGAMAEVPSLINYQGRLKEKSGTNVNGSKNFTVRIFDAKEGGKQTYEENIGAVVIKEGAYSFGFGEAGQSILDFSESLIVEEAGKQIFDFTLSRTPVAESLSILAGDFTWSEKTGSSDSDNLLVQYDKNSKSAKIIFLNSSPGKDAALKFDCLVEENGIMAGLASSPSSWLELVVGGETLSPRERLVAVPFALTSVKADRLVKPIEIVLSTKLAVQVGAHVLGSDTTASTIPLSFGQTGNYAVFDKIYIPSNLDKLVVKLYPRITQLGFNLEQNAERIFARIPNWSADGEWIPSKKYFDGKACVTVYDKPAPGLVEVAHQFEMFEFFESGTVTYKGEVDWVILGVR